MEDTGKSLLKEIRKEVIRDKISLFLFKNRFYIGIFFAVMIICVVAYVSYSYYIKNKADNNSLVFSKIKDDIIHEKNSEAIKKLDDLIKSGTNGYQFLSYMEKSSILLKENKINESVLVLKKARESISLPSYYKDMIRSIEFIVRSNNDKENLDDLINDIKSNLSEKDSFYFNNMEIYASLLAKQNKYNEAIEVYNKIIDGKDVPAEINGRSKRIRGVLFAYIE